MPARDYSSCRFEPYYQIQKWDNRALAWKGIAKTYASPEEAEQSVGSGTRYRLVTITERGRETSEERTA